MVVLAKTIAPASRKRAAGGASPGGGVRSLAAVPSGIGSPRVAILSLTVDRHAVERTDRLALRPARLGGARLLSACSGA